MQIKTNPEMNEQIVAILRQHDDPAVLYAAQRIEELEQQLRDARAAAQAQSETVQRDWLSPAEAEGLRRSLAYCNAECETAMKYAIEAEAIVDSQREEIRQLCHDGSELQTAFSAVLAEVSSGEAADSLAVINLRRAIQGKS